MTLTSAKRELASINVSHVFFHGDTLFPLLFEIGVCNVGNSKTLLANLF